MNYFCYEYRQNFCPTRSSPHCPALVPLKKLTPSSHQIPLPLTTVLSHFSTPLCLTLLTYFHLFVLFPPPLYDSYNYKRISSCSPKSITNTLNSTSDTSYQKTTIVDCSMFYPNSPKHPLPMNNSSKVSLIRWIYQLSITPISLELIKKLIELWLLELYWFVMEYGIEQGRFRIQSPANQSGEKDQEEL